MATLSDQVRHYVYRNYIVPAREKKIASFTVTAGDVHQALKFDSRRMSLVCAALNTAKFERQYGVRLLQRSGSGHGPTATFTFAGPLCQRTHPASTLLGGEHGIGTI
ncbi:MAG TPA: hypothetical protein VGV15_13500 [Terriglobales bacterium]|nr:hypothetical protein [Terriglobales bacterium]